MATKPNPDLATWVGLNEAMQDATEADCWQLLKEELKGKKRKQFVYRIHSKINRLRAHRERDDLQACMNNVVNRVLTWLK